MKTDVDTALKDIADWYIKNRREMTEIELASILKKHVESKAELEKFVSFLGTEPGQMRFKTLLRERKAWGGRGIPSLICGQCGAKFRSMKELDEHLKREHPEAYASAKPSTLKEPPAEPPYGERLKGWVSLYGGYIEYHPELEGYKIKKSSYDKLYMFANSQTRKLDVQIYLSSEKSSTLKENPAQVTWATPNSDDAAVIARKLRAIGASPTIEWRDWPSPAWYIETKPLSPSEWTRAKQIVAEFNSSTLKERKGGNPTQSPRLGNLGTPSDLYSKIVGSFIKSEQLIEEAWAENKMSQVIEFHGLKLEHDIERQIAFLQAFLKATRQKQLGKG